MPLQALAAVATLLSAAQRANHIDLRLDRGTAEVEWIGDSSFRFRRTLDGPLPPADQPDGDPMKVEVHVDDTPGGVRLQSKYLDVTVRKQGVLVRVRRRDGTALMTDLSEPRPDGAGVAWDREARAGVRFYGLGPRTDPSFDLRGKAVQAAYPFLLSTAGYGEYHPGTGPWRFDFTTAGRYRIHALRIDYFFCYGPTPKEVFEEHNAVRGPAETWPAAADRAPSWAALRDSLLRLVQGAMSAAFEPEFDLTRYAGAPPELIERARQVGSLVPKVTSDSVGLSGFRKQLDAFYDIYDVEARDHGHPTWHPLPFQFPEDPEAAAHVDEFMLGDEMLIAPITAPGKHRDVYLPQGNWTNLETNQQSRGRRTIAVESETLPVFARNGTIVPLNSGAALALHYFPTLGGEFFLIETDIGEYTQIHAAPAGDLMRLEIESKKEREYRWVVHHVSRPKDVGFGEQKYRQAQSQDVMTGRTWFYDPARKNLHVSVRVKAGEDCIVNLGF